MVIVSDPLPISGAIEQALYAIRKRGATRSAAFAELLGKFPEQGADVAKLVSAAFAEDAKIVPFQKGTAQIETREQLLPPVSPCLNKPISPSVHHDSQVIQEKSLGGTRHAPAGQTSHSGPAGSNQANQETSGQARTARTVRPTTSRHPMQAREFLTQEAGSDRLRAASAQLSPFLRPGQEWRLPFEVARVLRGIPNSNPNQYRKPLEEWWVENKVGMSFDDLFYAFMEAWSRVNCPAGQDAFDVSANRAREGPIVLVRDYGLVYQMVASFAFYAGAFPDDGIIQLPRARLAKWLEVTPRTISSVVRLLERSGIIVCVDDNYSYAERKAKSYKFIADETQVRIGRRTQ